MTQSKTSADAFSSDYKKQYTASRVVRTGSMPGKHHISGLSSRLCVNIKTSLVRERAKKYQRDDTNWILWHRSLLRDQPDRWIRLFTSPMMDSRFLTDQTQQFVYPS